jgi:hypothetical protein
LPLSLQSYCPACLTLRALVTRQLQMRAGEVDELQLQAASGSSTGIAFMRSIWSHVTDAAEVCVHVQLIRWLSGCFVGNKESGVNTVATMMPVCMLSMLVWIEI